MGLLAFEGCKISVVAQGKELLGTGATLCCCLGVYGPGAAFGAGCLGISLLLNSTSPSREVMREIN